MKSVCLHQNHRLDSQYAMIMLRRYALLIYVGLFCIAFALAYFRVIVLPKISVTWHLQDRDRYQPNYVANNGAELALIFIGSSGCVASNNSALPEMVETIKLMLETKAVKRGRAFTTVGIAKDWVANAGTNHLAKFGMFDEIMAGRSWINKGVMEYIWTDFPGVPSTPQVVVVDQFVVVPSNSGERFQILGQEVIARKVGLVEIKEWLELGLPLPQLRTLP